MKKIIIAALLIISIVGIVYFKKETIIHKEKIINSFEIQSENIPVCYPIDIVDYKEVGKDNNELMIFGRTVWSKKINSDLKEKPAVVPVEIYMKDNETGEQNLINRITSNPEDGNVVLIIKDQKEKYTLKIDYENAENCPKKFSKN